MENPVWALAQKYKLNGFMEDIDDENIIFRDACKKGKTISEKVWKASDYLEDLIDNYQKEF